MGSSINTLDRKDKGVVATWRCVTFGGIMRHSDRLRSGIGQEFPLIQCWKVTESMFGDDTVADLPSQSAVSMYFFVLSKGASKV